MAQWKYHVFPSSILGHCGVGWFNIGTLWGRLVHYWDIVGLVGSILGHCFDVVSLGKALKSQMLRLTHVKMST